MRLLILFLLLFNQLAFAQIMVSPDAPTIDKMMFKDKVKEIKIYAYYYQPVSVFDNSKTLRKGKNRQIMLLSYDRNGLLKKSVYKLNNYNNSGEKRQYRHTDLRTSDYTYYSNGTVKEVILSKKEKNWSEKKISRYYYDDNGRINKRTEQEILQKQAGIVKVFTYKYNVDKIQVFDDNNQLKTVDYLDSLGRVIKTVDHINGNPVYFKEYDYIYLEAKGEIDRVVTRYRLKKYRGQNIYDDKGYHIETQNLQGTRKIDRRFFRNSYILAKRFEREKIVSENITYIYRKDNETGEKKLISKVVPIYDEKGSLIKEYTSYYPEKEKKHLTITEYEIIYWKE